MELFPAIDLRAGRCVRLDQGDFAAETVYGDDPVARGPRRSPAAGAPWIHVVDLDAARTGEPANLSVVEKIVAAVPCAVQVGGGVRTPEAADALLLAGVDARRGRHGRGGASGAGGRAVPRATRAGSRSASTRAAPRSRCAGGPRGAGSTSSTLALRFERSGIAALIVTEIGRDGTMVGPDVEQLASVLDVTSMPVVASGGVGDLADLLALSALEVGGRELAGAIVGRAIYEGRFTVSEAIEALSL